MSEYSKLSIIMPAFNERATIAEAIRRVRQVELPLDREIVAVDDGSTDGTGEILKRLEDSTTRVITLSSNVGRGTAVQRGIETATGDLIVIQDADLEYDPRDLPRLMRPIMEDQAKVVFGSRFTGERRNMLYWHWVGNRFLSLTTNLLYNTTISDMETGYKMFDAGLLRSLNITASGFDFEPEVTAKTLRTGARVWEVPISYAGRELDEGKKITWRDGFPALWTLFKVRLMPMSKVLR